MTIAIVGSGAMGQLFGARLLLAGHDVVLLDVSQAVLDALNTRGVTLQTDLGEEHTEVRAARPADVQEEFDLFIIFTKGFHTEAAVESVAHLIRPASYGLTLQNGLGNAEILERAFGRDRTLLGMTDFPADMLEPGVVASNSRGKVRLGGLTDGAAANRIAHLLDSAGLHAAAVTDIRVPVWEKVAFNAALNTLSAVTGMTVGQIGADPHARRLAAEVVDETVRVAHGLDLDVSRERIADTLLNAYTHHVHHKTSMLLDREAGRRTEIESIGGEIVRLGQQAGIDTPVLRTLCDLVRAVTSPGGAT